MLLRVQNIAPLQGALCGLVDSINIRLLTEPNTQIVNIFNTLGAASGGSWSRGVTAGGLPGRRGEAGAGRPRWRKNLR